MHPPNKLCWSTASVAAAIAALYVGVIFTISGEDVRLDLAGGNLLMLPSPLRLASSIPQLQLLHRIERGKQETQKILGILRAQHAPFEDHVLESVKWRPDQHIRDKIKAAVLSKKQFVIGVQGTSITAGHDNYFWQSWPLQMEDIIQPAFEKAGVKVIVRNHAMGNQRIHPIALCVEKMLGDDIDVAMLEMALFGAGQENVEMWIRNALAIPTRPALFFTAGLYGAEKGEIIPVAREIRPQSWHWEAWDPYIASGFSIAALDMGLLLYSLAHLDKYSTARMMADRVAPHADYHPGPHHHRLRGEIVSYILLKLLHEVLSELEGDAHDIPFDSLVRNSSSGSPLPPPALCGEAMCGSATTCATTNEPRIGPSLADHVLSREPMRMVDASVQLKEWHIRLIEGDLKAVERADEKGLGFLDRKFVVQGTVESGPLLLRFQVIRPNTSIMLCHGPTSNVPDLFSRYTIVKVDDGVIDMLGEDAARHEQVADFSIGNPPGGTICYVSRQTLRAGPHEMEILPIMNNGTSEVIPLSHLIWW